MKLPFFVLTFALVGAFHATRSEAEILFFGKGADLTFYYNSAGDDFDVVFRPKTDNAVEGEGWTGGTLYNTPRLGGNALDRSFTSLTLQVNDPIVRQLGGNDYYSIGPSSSAAAGRPDLGIRMVFRDSALVDPIMNPAGIQFQTLRMTLDWNASTKPLGSEFALWNLDSFGNPSIVRLDTSNNLLSTDWSSAGHSHWIYGFSELGTYDLRFNIQGLDAGLNPVTSLGSFNLGVTAVPEPATTGLLATAFGLFAAAKRFRRRTGEAEQPTSAA